MMKSIKETNKRVIQEVQANNEVDNEWMVEIVSTKQMELVPAPVKEPITIPIPENSPTHKKTGQIVRRFVVRRLIDFTITIVSLSTFTGNEVNEKQNNSKETSNTIVIVNTYNNNYTENNYNYTENNYYIDSDK